ncbi:hypothetical protein ACJIZ3_016852 [Penstemon smallii]|uniref:Uncharacterized protein n=1 Tax=Penstemon smallii TaxID=265156 RepID=A0ABD3STV9_9LAMI
MGRNPCCEKMGLKKGPWTSEEDLTLVNYINENGHDNWRALPKRAGLLRCGKSCRLRWMNYLRPDIKRGNFTREEEETIIKLHQELGNRWSVMAAKLPGRTDNEIKNVWHTHLKKKLNKKPQPGTERSENRIRKTESFDLDTDRSSELHSSSEISSVTNTTATIADEVCLNTYLDESFWSEVFPGDDSSATSDFSSGNSDYPFQVSMDALGSDLNMVGGTDFWYDLFYKAEELIMLP